VLGAVFGALLGAVVASVVFAPAAWLAAALQSASGERLLLADARGSVWRGSAVLVLTGGPGSRDASALPGRLHWTLGPAPGAAGLELRARQACCLNGQAVLRLQPGWGRLRVQVQPGEGGAGASASGPAVPALIGQWPAAWLVGLGTPWNTLQPSGQLRLRSPGLGFEMVQGSLRISGSAELDLDDIASRISTLEVLGSYRLKLQGDRVAAAGATEAAEAVAQAVDTQGAALSLSTRSGALQLSGNGLWAAGRLRFRGEARAAPGAEAVLSNLLNIIGRRQGAAAVISIG
jgi:general secretion pathway protein N